MKLGRERLFILSAGWADRSEFSHFLSYDITFTAQADAYKRGRRGDGYQDFSMLRKSRGNPCCSSAARTICLYSTD
jgi:hypothetical protein